MRKQIERAATGASFKCRLPLSSRALLAAAVGLVAAGALVPQLLHAQTEATQTPAQSSTSTPKPVHHRKRPSPAHLLVDPAPATPAPVMPPVPETPKWPAFDKAAEASVVWDSHGLTIDAANSSLDQILKDVSMATGTRVEGLATDQRVFGAYGPGQPRDVLSQLLQGSGYNVIMIGDEGQGAPRQILLSVRQASVASATAAKNIPAGNEDEDVEEAQPAPEPATNHPGFAPPGGPGGVPSGVPSRSPQQIMQDMQLHQQQQQQLQQGQQQPVTQPPQQPPTNAPN
jgi:hypothetical protein